MPWRLILLPHDFSPCAVRAERLACELAEVHGARLLLLHVASTPPHDDEPPTSSSRASTRPPPPSRPPSTRPPPPDSKSTRPPPLDPRARLEHIASTLRVRGLDVVTEALVGEPLETILAAAHEHRADAIVMGTHGRRGLQRLLLGSIAEDVLRRADIPVVTIRYEDEEGMNPLLMPVGVPSPS